MTLLKLLLCVDTSVVEYVALLVSGSGSGYLIVLDVIYPKLDQLQRRVMTLLLKRWNTSNIRRISAATVFAIALIFVIMIPSCDCTKSCGSSTKDA